MYWVSYVLRGRYHYSEDDEKDDSESMVQAVDEVVIVPNIYLSDAGNSADSSCSSPW